MPTGVVIGAFSAHFVRRTLSKPLEEGVPADETNRRSVAVGINAGLAYTGAVNAIANVSSTTVNVIDCRY